MKTLKNLDEKPLSFEDDVPESVRATMPTFRKLMKAAIGMTAAKNGEESVDLFQIGLKLAVDGDVQLEDAEFKLLNEACEKNPAQWIAHYQGQVIIKLRASEK